MTQTLDITRRHESTAVNTFALGIDPPVFVRGRGAALWTEDGRRYIDLVCGSATTGLGHGHPAHLAAIRAELDTGILHTGTRLPSPARARLYERLASVLPPELSAIHLANSGSEAVETALKVTQYARGGRRLIAFDGGYHGRTLGALAVTAARRVRLPFEPLPGEVDFAPYPTDICPGSAASAEACLMWLQARVESVGSAADMPTAVIVEAVQGVSGVIVPPPEFLRGLRALCDRTGLLLVVDEIWNGFGRTGRMFAFEHSGILPDIVVMGKGLSGSLPLSAVAARPEILHDWPAGIHTSTFQGNPLACAAAVATIDVLLDEDLPARCRSVIEPALRSFLDRVAGQDGVADLRVIGAMAGIELVDAAERPDKVRVARLQRRCQDDGVLVYGGGRDGNVLMLVPPLVITHEDLELALDVVRNALRSEPPTPVTTLL